MFVGCLQLIWVFLVVCWLMWDMCVRRWITDQSIDQVITMSDGGQTGVGRSDEIEGRSDSVEPAAAAQDEHFAALHDELRQMKSMVEMLLPYKHRLDALDNPPSRQEVHSLLDRLRALEREKSVLIEENGTQRRLYERCINDVTGHVVHVLLAQKTLRSECLELQQRVEHLERQNHRLQLLVQQTFSSLTCATLQALNEATELCSRDEHISRSNVCLPLQKDWMCDTLNGSTQTAEMCDSFNSLSSAAVSSHCSLNAACTSNVSTSSVNVSCLTCDACERSTLQSFELRPTVASVSTQLSDAPVVHSAVKHHRRPKCSRLKRTRRSQVDGHDIVQHCTALVHSGQWSGFCCTANRSRSHSQSPAADLLELSDLYLSRFVVDEGGSGRMFLKPRSVIHTDSDSDDCHSLKFTRPNGRLTSSTLSLNDLLDGSESDSSTPVTPDGGRLIDTSDYERLVVTDEEEHGLASPLCNTIVKEPLLPQSLIFNPGLSVAAAKSADSSPEDGEYMTLAEDEYVRIDGSVPAVHLHTNSTICPGDNLAAVPETNETASHSEEKNVSSVQVGDSVNGITRPTVLLLRRRKQTLTTSTFVDNGIQCHQSAETALCRANDLHMKHNGGVQEKGIVYRKSPLSTSSYSSGSDVGCGSFGSHEHASAPSSDYSDLLVDEKRVSSLDDGYCTARSVPPLQDKHTHTLNRRSPLCCHLGRIISSSEDVMEADAEAKSDNILQIPSDNVPAIHCSRSSDGICNRWRRNSPATHRQICRRSLCEGHLDINGLIHRVADGYHKNTSPLHYCPSFSAGDQPAQVRDICGADCQPSSVSPTASPEQQQCSVNRNCLIEIQSERRLSDPSPVIHRCNESVHDKSQSEIRLQISTVSRDGQITDDVERAIEMFSFLDDQDDAAVSTGVS